MIDLTFAEMFSGIGGFRLGLERSGWRCVWANDNDKYANRVYKKKFGDGELVEGDIREVKANSVPNHTLLTAGFPCQAFSVAGKRKGFKEARGTLFTHIVRVASVKRPKLLLLENVKGLLSSEFGRTFATILRALGNLGYLLEWQVLNSEWFGVPQRRKRLFIIGHLGEERRKRVFPLKLESVNAKGDGTRMDGLCLQASNVDDKDCRACAMSLRSNGNARYYTETECERLQGFPDGWTKGISKMQRYKLLGNAVTVNVVEFLGKKLMGCLD